MSKKAIEVLNDKLESSGKFITKLVHEIKELEAENKKLREYVELLLTMKTNDADNLYIKQDVRKCLAELGGE